MSRRSTDMEKEHEINESLKGHKIVQTCHHVQELGIKPTRHNQDDNLVCAECILDFFMAMGRGKDERKSQEEIILEYAHGDQTYSICLDCSNKSQYLEELK